MGALDYEKLETAIEQMSGGEPPLGADAIREELDAAESTFDMDESHVIGETAETIVSQGMARFGGVEVRFTSERSRDGNDPNEQVLVGGYMGVKLAYRRARHEFAVRHKGTTTYSSVRWAGLGNLLSWDHARHPELLPAMAAHAVVKAVSEETESKVDLNGHSWGGPVSQTEAEHAPDRVRSLLLTAAAGMERHKFTDMRERGRAFWTDELWPARRQLRQLYEPRIVRQILTYALLNPYRTGAEGIAAGSYFMIPRVAWLDRSGLPVAAHQFKKDRLFPEELVAVNKGAVSVYSVLDNPDAGHMAPQLFPAEVAEAQIEIFSRLNASKPRQKAA